MNGLILAVSGSESLSIFSPSHYVIHSPRQRRHRPAAVCRCPSVFLGAMSVEFTSVEQKEADWGSEQRESGYVVGKKQNESQMNTAGATRRRRKGPERKARFQKSGD